MKQEPSIKTTITKDDLRNQVQLLVQKDSMTYAEAICEVCEQTFGILIFFTNMCMLH